MRLPDPYSRGQRFGAPAAWEELINTAFCAAFTEAPRGAERLWLLCVCACVEGMGLCHSVQRGFCWALVMDCGSKHHVLLIMY